MTLSQQQRNDLEAIVGRWREALAAWQLTGSDRDRDAAILRFKLAYEVAWKHLQRLIREQGLESNGPRQAFENAFRLGWIEDEVLWSDAIKARNTAIHVYRESIARELAGELERLLTGFQSLLKKLPTV
jgi:nucleotidyltransferase substrate binding protein (TIGR01987 family)